MVMQDQAWNGFAAGEWQRSIDVRSFIQKNWTPYLGDDAFLTGPTRRTKAVWKRCEELLLQELKNGDPGCGYPPGVRHRQLRPRLYRQGK